MTENDKYYRTIDTGGYSPCILGNNAIIPRGDPRNVLPNCVGLATGLFNEMGSYGYCKYLGNTNANNFINLARSQGLEIGMTPKVGACMVWDDGQCGHVAIVKKILDPYAVWTVHSGWNASMYEWECSQYLGEDGNWLSGNPDEPNNNLSWLNQTNGYRFLGFIYNPALEVDKTLPNPVEQNKDVPQLEVTCNDTMRVRLDYNVNGEIIGFAKKGFYNILNIVIGDDYTWYEVEKNKWIALFPPYTEFIPAQEQTDDEDEELAIELINRDKHNPLVEFIVWIIKLIQKWKGNKNGDR